MSAPMRFNPPPNWPTPPIGWAPGPDWAPDPVWGPPPRGWPLWVPEAEPVPASRRSVRRRAWIISAVIVLAVVVTVSVVFMLNTPSDTTTTQRFIIDGTTIDVDVPSGWTASEENLDGIEGVFLVRDGESLNAAKLEEASEAVKAGRNPGRLHAVVISTHTPCGPYAPDGWQDDTTESIGELPPDTRVFSSQLCLPTRVVLEVLGFDSDSGTTEPIATVVANDLVHHRGIRFVPGD